MLPFSVVLFISTIIDTVFSISCYQCSSINGSNPACEDFFHGELEGVPAMLQTPCLTSSRGRQGRFLATHCIKLVAYSSEPNPVQYVYRTCSRDEGDDDSITRMSHCGFLKLHWINPNRRLRGCLHICDKDASYCPEVNFIEPPNIRSFSASFYPI
ncbi:unnamed protein product [Adineta ricciae]|uniref:Protein quiver n=1 Tax=Adineta ricciae TaxID=249248 RepID=A0A814M312_ADIRI|nr:unnamed protein product [Adineta ricciae]